MWLVIISHLAVKMTLIGFGNYHPRTRDQAIVFYSIVGIVMLAVVVPYLYRLWKSRNSISVEHDIKNSFLRTISLSYRGNQNPTVRRGIKVKLWRRKYPPVNQNNTPLEIATVSPISYGSLKNVESTIEPLDPPPTPEEIHEAEINPWPGHTMRETILRNRENDSGNSGGIDLPNNYVGK